MTKNASQNKGTHRKRGLDYQHETPALQPVIVRDSDGNVLRVDGPGTITAIKRVPLETSPTQSGRYEKGRGPKVNTPRSHVPRPRTPHTKLGLVAQSPRRSVEALTTSAGTPIVSSGKRRDVALVQASPRSRMNKGKRFED